METTLLWPCLFCPAPQAHDLVGPHRDVRVPVCAEHVTAGLAELPDDWRAEDPGEPEAPPEFAVDMARGMS